MLLISMNILTKDENNKNIILDSTKKHQIIMEWEKPYMETCIQKLQPFGDVLEIGFGLGYSATEIQKFSINSYTVIECDEETYKRALEWKKQYNHPINVIFDKWENIYKILPKFDCIFFDDYDIESIKLSKLNPKFQCRNINFVKKIRSNLKNYIRFSFYCAINKNELVTYYNQWEKFLKNYNSKYKINFEACEINVPKNCNYITNKTLYCTLIELKELFNYQ